MLNNKYIPLKLFENTNDNQYLIAAWHWRWSITWRWLIKWKPCRTKFYFSRWTNPSNGHGTVQIGLGRLGLIHSAWQPNMDRKKAEEAAKEEEERL